MSRICVGVSGPNIPDCSVFFWKMGFHQPAIKFFRVSLLLAHGARLFFPLRFLVMVVVAVIGWVFAFVFLSLISKLCVSSSRSKYCPRKRRWAPKCESFSQTLDFGSKPAYIAAIWNDLRLFPLVASSRPPNFVTSEVFPRLMAHSQPTSFGCIQKIERCWLLALECVRSTLLEQTIFGYGWIKKIQALKAEKFCLVWQTQQSTRPHLLLDAGVDCQMDKVTSDEHRLQRPEISDMIAANSRLNGQWGALQLQNKSTTMSRNIQWADQEVSLLIQDFPSQFWQAQGCIWRKFVWLSSSYQADGQWCQDKLFAI